MRWGLAAIEIECVIGLREVVPDRSRLVVVFLDDFEDISVRVAKEEANKRRLAQRLDQGCAPRTATALSTEETRRGQR